MTERTPGIRSSRGATDATSGVASASLALYNPLTNNWGEGVLVAGKPLPAPGDAASGRYGLLHGAA